MKPRKPLVSALLAASAVALSLGAGAATVAHVEQFRVGFGSLVSPGVQFSDGFSDGIPPPIGPVTANPMPPALPYPAQFGLPPPSGGPGDPTPNVYSLNVSPAGQPLLEMNDRLYLDSAKGNPTVNALGQARLISAITLLTDNASCANPSDCPGLRRSGAFVASVLLELTTLNAPNDFQALMLGDRRPKPGDPTATIGGNVQFGPVLEPDGHRYLTLITQDYSVNSRSMVRHELLAPPAGADGISLLFEHLPDSNDVYAYYRYYDDQRATGGTLRGMGELVYFATATDALFHDGADWTRAGIAVTQAVPEPATWATLLVGMSLVGMRLWKQRKSKTSAAVY